MQSHEPQPVSRNVWKGFTRDKGVRQFALVILGGVIFAVIFILVARPRYISDPRANPCQASPEVQAMLRKNGNCKPMPFRDVPRK